MRRLPADGLYPVWPLPVSRACLLPFWLLPDLVLSSTTNSQGRDPKTPDFLRADALRVRNAPNSQGGGPQHPLSHLVTLLRSDIVLLCCSKQQPQPDRGGRACNRGKIARGAKYGARLQERSGHAGLLGSWSPHPWLFALEFCPLVKSGVLESPPWLFLYQHARPTWSASIAQGRRS